MIPPRHELLEFQGSKKELAAKYGVSLSTVYRWLKPRIYNEVANRPRYRLEPTHKVCVIRADGSVER